MSSLNTNYALSPELLESINYAQDAVRDANVLFDKLAVSREIHGAAAWRLQNSFRAVRDGMGDTEVHLKLVDAHVACSSRVRRLLAAHIRAVACREEALDDVRFFTARAIARAIFRDVFRGAARDVFRGAARAALDRALVAPLALVEARAINHAVRFEHDSHQDAHRDLLAAKHELLSASNSHSRAVTRYDEAVHAHRRARRDDELALIEAATAAFYSKGRVFGTGNFLEVRAVTRSVLASEAIEEANLSLVLAKDNRVKSARAARCADRLEIDAWDMVGILLARRKNAHHVLRAAMTVRSDDAVRSRRDALGL